MPNTILVLLLCLVLGIVYAQDAINWVPCPVVQVGTIFTSPATAASSSWQLAILKQLFPSGELNNLEKSIFKHPSFEPEWDLDALRDAVHDTDPQKGRRQGTDQPTDVIAHCATVNVPLVWQDSTTPQSTKTIPFFMKRYRSAKTVGTKGTLFTLQGGPGGDGSVFDYISTLLLRSSGYSFDIIAPDHRGTTRSEYLTCDVVEKIANPSVNDYKACADQLVAKYGSASAVQKGFSTTAAARDVLHAMELLRKDNPTYRIGIYGVSYGTFWLNRILQLNPGAVDYAIQDSVANPKDISFYDWNKQFELVGNNLFDDRCKASSFCTTKFASYGGGAAAVRAAFEAMKTAKNSCASTINPVYFKLIMNGYLTQYATRAIVPAAIYRILRCNPDDQNAMDNLGFLLDSLAGSLPPIGALQAKKLAVGAFSLLLNNLIGCSELVGPTPSRDAAVNDAKSIPPYFANPFAITQRLDACAGLEKVLYSDPLTRQIAPYSKNLLHMQAGLDPQTGIEQAQSYISYYNQSSTTGFYNYLYWPNGVHSAIGFRRKSSQSRFCGIDTVASFTNYVAANPNTPASNSFDSSCIRSDSEDEPTVLYDRGVPAGLPNIVLGNSLYEGGPSFNLRSIQRYFTLFLVVVGLILGCCCCCCCVCVVAIVGCIITCIVKVARPAPKGDLRHQLLDNNPVPHSSPAPQYPATNQYPSNNSYYVHTGAPLVYGDGSGVSVSAPPQASVYYVQSATI